MNQLELGLHFGSEELRARQVRRAGLESMTDVDRDWYVRFLKARRDAATEPSSGAVYERWLQKAEVAG